MALDLLLLLLLGGFAAGFVNAVAGAGAALTMPLLLLSGLDASVANGTNRVGVLAQTIASVATFHGQGIRPWRRLWWAIPLTICAAIIGAFLATSISPHAMKRAFGITFVGLAVAMLLKPRWLLRAPADGQPRAPTAGVIVALLGIGLYGGLIQIGVGIPLLIVLARGLRLDLVTANALKASVILGYSFAVLFIFQGAGQIDWGAGAALAVGAVGGGFVGARSAVRRGAGFIRKVVLVTLVVAAVKFLVD